MPLRTRDRPADVLTIAVPTAWRLVASPAAAACDDAAQAMRMRKLSEREPVRIELEQASMVYKLLVFTTFRRPDAAALDIIKSIVRHGARKKG